MAKKRICRLVVSMLVVAAISLTVSSIASADCTMALIGRNGTADGSILVYHNEELSPNTSQRFIVVPRMTHNPGEVINAGNEVVPQVPITYKTVVVAYGEGGYGPGDSEWAAGINEYGVTLAANRTSSKEKALPSGQGIPYGWLTQITLERSRTAREAVEVLGSLIDTYGRASGRQSEWGLADQNEAWILEQSITHWVARRVHDGELLPITNRYGIGTDYELASPDVVDFAVAQGWYDPNGGPPFSWKDVYGVPATQNSANLIRRHNRINDLLLPKWGNIKVRDVLELKRDHYEGTDDYYYPPHEFPGISMYGICSRQNVFGMVYQLRDWLPTEIGAVMWHNMAAPCSSVHVPVYAGITEVPDVYAMPLSGTSDPVSAWWRFMNLRMNVDTDHEALNPHVREQWYKFEEQEFNQVPGLEERALYAYEKGDIEKAHKMLTQYTNVNLLDAYNKAGALNNWVLDQIETTP